MSDILMVAFKIRSGQKMRHKILGVVSDLDFFLDNMSKEKRPHKIHVKMAMYEKYAFFV